MTIRLFNILRFKVANSNSKIMGFDIDNNIKEFVKNSKKLKD